MPRNLHEMIVRQIDRLLPEEQRLLVAASAIGAEFCAAAVAGGMNRDVAEVEQACADLARKGQVLNADGIEEWPDGTVSGRYGFLHAFYQEVLYERRRPDDAPICTGELATRLRPDMTRGPRRLRLCSLCILRRAAILKRRYAI